MTQIVLPKLNQTGTNEWADVQDNDVAIRDAVNGLLQNDNIKSDAAIAHSKLANITAGAVLLGNGSNVPTATALSGAITVNSSGVTAVGAASQTNYKTLLAGQGVLGADAAGGDYFINGGANPGQQVDGCYRLLATEHALGSLTPKLNIRGSVAVNGTAPGITFLFRLFPITAAGGADTLTVTFGAPVTGSTATLATPGANSVLGSADSADFALPADGAYALGVTLSSTIANNSRVGIWAELRIRHV